MPEKKLTYRPQDLSLIAEQGHGADIVAMTQVFNKIRGEWNLKDSRPANPVLLLLGGLQGSGKSTTTTAIREPLNAIVISSDQIRHELFQQMEPSEQCLRTLNAIRNALITDALRSGHHVILDQNATATRIQLFQDLIKDFPDYRLKRVYLDASVATLESRIVARSIDPTKNNDDVQGLHTTMQVYPQPDFSLYDKTLDTEAFSPLEIQQRILNLFI